MTPEQLIQTWRIEGSVAIHLRKALQDTCSEERFVERLLFGDTWTRTDICGSLYEALFAYADGIATRLNGIAEQVNERLSHED